MFNRAWLAGGIPRTACVAAYEPICAVSLADSYINRANPGTLNAYVRPSAPTWAAPTGWTFNGSQGLLIDLTGTDDLSYIIRFSGATNSGVDRMIFGSYGVVGAGARIGFATSISNQVLYSHQGSAYVAPGLLSGVLAVSGQQGYRDGLADGSTFATDSATYSTKQAIGLWHLSDGAQYGFWQGNIQALYVYNVPITPTQVKAVTDAMNMLPMRPQLPRFRSWLAGGALTQFRKALGLRTGSRGVPE